MPLTLISLKYFYSPKKLCEVKIPASQYVSKPPKQPFIYFLVI